MKMWNMINSKKNGQAEKHVESCKKKYFSSFDKYLFILSAGVVLYILFMALHNIFPKNSHGIVTNMLFSKDDRYMDFFNLLHDSQTKSFIGLSPIWMLILHFLNIIMNGGLNIDTVSGQVVFFVYNMLSLILFAVAINLFMSKFNIKLTGKIWLFTAFLFSYPVIFSFDRGNWALLTAAIMSLFTAFYVRKNTILAALLLGIAISFKFYPAVFILIFIINKRWIETAVCIITAGILILAPLAYFEGGFINNIKYLLHGVAAYRVAGNMASVLAHNASIYGMFYTIKCIMLNDFNLFFRDYLKYNLTIKIISMLILLVTSVLALTPKIKDHDRFLLLVAAMILFPVSANDYMIPMALLPSIYWLLMEPSDKMMPWLTGLFFICKRYYAFYNMTNYLSVTIQSILNPLLLLLIICYIIWIRREVLVDFGKKTICKKYFNKNVTI